jgi:hypothetical protein
MPMSIPFLLEDGLVLLGLLLAAALRARLRRRRLKPRRSTPLDRLPDSQKLSGVPLRILLSDGSGPGAVLRDRLHIDPSHRH